MKVPKSTAIYASMAAVSVVFSITYGLGKGFGAPAGPQAAAVDSKLITQNLLLAKEWVLVEFGDFECPACRRNSPEVSRFAREQGDKVDFEFRHMVLKRHRLATEAAVICEVARTQGKFDACREFFMTGDDLSSEKMTQGKARFAAQASPEERGQARARIGKDMEAASKLGIDAIPALYLVHRSRTVYKVNSLAEAAQLVR